MQRLVSNDSSIFWPIAVSIPLATVEEGPSLWGVWAAPPAEWVTAPLAAPCVAPAGRTAPEAPPCGVPAFAAPAWAAPATAERPSPGFDKSNPRVALFNNDVNKSAAV